MTVEVHTRQGVVIVDDQDSHLVASAVFVVRGTYSTHVRVRYEGKHLRLSRLIAKAPTGFVVDHINGDPLDNRRANLRICTVQQNNWNRRRRPSGHSRFKGVTLSSGRWTAFIAPNGKQVCLGSFPTEEEAALAYDAAARDAYGHFACLNFPPEGARSAAINHAVEAKP
jgi:hypothetical protein